MRLLQHGLLLFLFFLLPVHDTEDDLSLLLGEVAQVGHLRQDRPAAGPDWSRHLYTLMLKEINNQTYSVMNTTPCLVNEHGLLLAKDSKAKTNSTVS